MRDIEAEIRGLKKPEPSARFCRDSKNRLMNRIEMYEHESWFARILSKLSPVFPSDSFVQSAKMRLMAKISSAKKPLFGWYVFTKRIVASSLVMIIAVTSVLFATGNKVPASASENSYIAITSGSVAIKHADKIIWDVITKQTELSEGDLIQLGSADTAVIHFFDDSEVRLASNSILLVTKMKISRGYDRQGVIDVSLHQGRAWIQTLNVDDGSALFTVTTPDAVISSPNASFDVETNLTEPTHIRVFRQSVDVEAVQKESRSLVAAGRLNPMQQVYIDVPVSKSGVLSLSSFTKISDISDSQRDDEWVKANMLSDNDHLVTIRERELASIRGVAGTLPGDMFYPLKRAKENLTLAFTFNRESQTNAQIDIANQRLSESIVLLERGETEKAKEALSEYQDLVKRITDKNGSQAELSNKVVAAHQKTLIAALPSDSQIGIVQQVLDQTEIMLADSPVQKAEIRLQNSMDDLAHIQDFIASGDYTAASEALSKHESLASGLLADVTQFTDDDQRKDFYSKILDNQYEERRILAQITHTLKIHGAPDELLALAQDTDRKLGDGIQTFASTVKPVMPDIQIVNNVGIPFNNKLSEFADKLNIYSSWTGKKNQLAKLLEQNPQYASDINFLTKLQSRLDTRTKDLVTAKIIALKADKVEAKGKRIQLKINRARQQMEMRAGK